VPVRHDAISAGSGICDELVAQVAEIRDLLTAADHWAQADGAETVTAEHA